jgi:carboxyl-terminal processing protease
MASLIGSISAAGATSLHASAPETSDQVHCQYSQENELPQGIQATLAVLAAEKQYKDVREAWQDSGVTMNTLRYFVNNENCNSDNTSFSGCAWAINQVLSHADDHKARVWVPRDYFDQHKAQFQAIELDGGQLVLTQWLPEPDKKKSLESRRALNQAYIQLRNKNLDQGTGIGFDKILHHAETLALGKDRSNEAMVAVDGWNAYLSVSNDPHSAVWLSWAVPVQTHSSVGLGFRTQKSGNDFFVFPEPHSPMEKAGIRKGDILLAIDGIPAQDSDFYSESSKLLGKEGTSVKLTILRDGKESNFEVKRQTLVHPVALDEVISVGDKNVGYLKLTEFNDRSCSETKAGLIKVLESNPTGLILDLRGNLGGWVEAARCVAGIFLPPQTEVVRAGSDDLELTSDAPLTDLPLVVLTNSMSASAAEILSGALQDHQRAIVVGERSFGKGSFQTSTPDPGNPKVSYAMTAGTYSLPRGRSPQLTGILPDIEVFQSPSIVSEENSPSLREEDLFINPLKSDSAITPSLNFKKARQVRECLAGLGTSRAEYEARLKARKFADYQLLSAADALGRCWNEPGSAAKKVQEISSCQDLKNSLKETASSSQRDLKLLQELSARFQKSEKNNPAYSGSSTALRDYRTMLELDDRVTEEKALSSALQKEIKNRRCIK